MKWSQGNIVSIAIHPIVMWGDASGPSASNPRPHSHLTVFPWTMVNKGELATSHRYSYHYHYRDGLLLIASGVVLNSLRAILPARVQNPRGRDGSPVASVFAMSPGSIPYAAGDMTLHTNSIAARRSAFGMRFLSTDPAAPTNPVD
jgi:hypothetical protein